MKRKALTLKDAKQLLRWLQEQIDQWSYDIDDLGIKARMEDVAYDIREHLKH